MNESIGDLHTLRGEYKAALGCLESAAALRAGNSEDLGRIEHKWGEIFRRQGEWDLAEFHFQTANDLLAKTNNPGKQAKLYADWSLMVYQSGQPERSLELAQQALALAETTGDQHALIQAHKALGILTRNQGDLKAATHHLDQSLEIARLMGKPGDQIAILNNLALVYGESGELERAIALSLAALELCLLLGDRHHEAALHNNLADLYHAVGQTEVSMSHLKQAVAILAEIGDETGDLKPEIWKMVEW